LGISTLYASRILPDIGAHAEVAVTTFDKREEGFEQQYAHEAELRFRATARRNKLLGLWAAGRLGLTGEAADNYAKDLVVSDFAQRDSEIFSKLRRDFDANGVILSDHQIRRTMDEFMARAIAQIKSA
jgi:hypothetical protein